MKIDTKSQEYGVEGGGGCTLCSTSHPSYQNGFCVKRGSNASHFTVFSPCGGQSYWQDSVHRPQLLKVKWRQSRIKPQNQICQQHLANSAHIHSMHERQCSFKTEPLQSMVDNPTVQLYCLHEEIHYAAIRTCQA